jgi:hypothetical protein
MPQRLAHRDLGQHDDAAMFGREHEVPHCGLRQCGLSCSFAGSAVMYSPASRKVLISPPGNGIGASKARDQVIRRTARHRRKLISYRFRIRARALGTQA